MTKSTWVVHAVASCEDCDFLATGYKNAQAIGARHAKTHHHKVMVEVGLCSEYDYRGETQK
jgi:hypothetical protein